MLKLSVAEGWKCISGQSPGSKCKWVKWDFAGSHRSHLVSRIAKVCQHRRRARAHTAGRIRMSVQSISIFSFHPNDIFLSQIYFYHTDRTTNWCHILKPRFVSTFVEFIVPFGEDVILGKSRSLTSFPKLHSVIVVLHHFVCALIQAQRSGSKNIYSSDRRGYCHFQFIFHTSKSTIRFLFAAIRGTATNQECKTTLSHIQRIFLETSSNTWYCVLSVYIL